MDKLKLLPLVILRYLNLQIPEAIIVPHQIIWNRYTGRWWVHGLLHLVQRGGDWAGWLPLWSKGLTWNCKVREVFDAAHLKQRLSEQRLLVAVDKRYRRPIELEKQRDDSHWYLRVVRFSASKCRKQRFVWHFRRRTELYTYLLHTLNQAC